MRAREDGAPTPPAGLDADYIEVSILASITALAEFLTQAEHADPGDLGICLIPVEGGIQVVVAESDQWGSVGLHDGAHLVGWVQPNDMASWVFVPCTERVGWSGDKNRWVPMDEIRTANVARRLDASS